MTSKTGTFAGQLLHFAESVDIVDDRVDHDFSCMDRADAKISATVEDGLVPRHAAPSVDAGEGDLIVAIELLADRRVHAVAGNRQRALPGRKFDGK